MIYKIKYGDDYIDVSDEVDDEERENYNPLDEKIDDTLEFVIDKDGDKHL